MSTTILAQRRTLVPSDAVFLLPASLLGSGFFASGLARVPVGLLIALVGGALVWLIRGLITSAIVVTPSALKLRRRFGTVTVPRTSIRKVRGDNEQRPEWSTTVVVDADERTITLPNFPEPPVRQVLEQLQEWHEGGPSQGDDVPSSRS